MKLCDLLQRATGGMRMQKELTFKPSIFYRLLNDQFSVWCDYHAPQNEIVDDTTAYDLMTQQQGYEYEQQWVKQHYPDALKIKPDWGLQALKNTLKAMLNGVTAIHQANLWLLPDEYCGKADLLVRCDDAGSDLGNYYYSVKEIKDSLKLSEYHKLQAGFYNTMLGKLQGYTPELVTIALRDREERIEFDEDLIQEIKSQLAIWRDLRDNKYKPLPKKYDQTNSPWRVYANKILRQTMDFTLIPDIGPATRERLMKILNKKSIAELYGMPMDQMADILKDVCDAEALYYHVEAYRSNKLVCRAGTKLVIPRRKKQLYMDFETSDDVYPSEPPHVYLIGLWDAEKDKFISFLAKGAGDEKTIFKKLIDYVTDPTDTCIYHWASFETETMTKEVMVRYPDMKDGLQKLIDCCIDLKEVVKQQVFLPVSTYSIKLVAPFFGFKWRHKDIGAFESMVLYWDYLKDGKSKTIQKVLDYNEDDCRAMVHVDKALSVI